MAQHTGPLAGVWRWSGTAPLPSGGWVVQSEANRYDTVAQFVHSLHRYDVFDASGSLERTSMLRLTLAYLYPPEIRGLLESSGFTDVTICGGFDGRLFTQDGHELVGGGSSSEHCLATNRSSRASASGVGRSASSGGSRICRDAAGSIAGVDAPHDLSDGPQRAPAVLSSPGPRDAYPRTISACT